MSRNKKALMGFVTMLLAPIEWAGFWLNYFRMLFMCGWVRAELMVNEVIDDKTEIKEQK